MNMRMSAVQAMVNGMADAMQKARAGTQMTLGQLIAALEAMPPEGQVVGLGELMSYRGYYSDLAFRPTLDARTVANLLDECRKAMGATFEGYKGGDFTMGAVTPLWVSDYGRCSDLRLMGLDTTDAVAKPIISLEREP